MVDNKFVHRSQVSSVLTTFFFLLPQAISDLFVCLITMPLTVVRLVELPSWHYGDTACVLSSLAEGVNLVVSSLTACAIAIDRLFMVLRRTPGQNDEKASCYNVAEALSSYGGGGSAVYLQVCDVQ